MMEAMAEAEGIDGLDTSVAHPARVCLAVTWSAPVRPAR
jgi:hypothetical protein